MDPRPTPHLDKLTAAIANEKCHEDVALLREALDAYRTWIEKNNSLQSKGRQRVADLVVNLNEYKDYLEVELIAGRGSAFIKRQKGQLKLDNSVIEEFLPYLVVPEIIEGLPDTPILLGPHKTFLNLNLAPPSLATFDGPPEALVKTKDQDFIIGKTVFYKFSSDSKFKKRCTAEGRFALAALVAECKTNFDKTMFSEAIGTAITLKQTCPQARYYVLAEYLDMVPEDTRLTSLNNVYPLRKCKRLAPGKRHITKEIGAQHRDFPIDADVIWQFTEEIQHFVHSIWYDPEKAIKRGSFRRPEMVIFESLTEKDDDNSPKREFKQI